MVQNVNIIHNLDKKANNECLPGPSKFPIVNSALELTGLQNVSRIQSSGSGSVWIHPDSLDMEQCDNIQMQHHVIEDRFHRVIINFES